MIWSEFSVWNDYTCCFIISPNGAASAHAVTFMTHSLSLFHLSMVFKFTPPCTYYSVKTPAWQNASFCILWMSTGTTCVFSPWQLAFNRHSKYTEKLEFIIQNIIQAPTHPTITANDWKIQSTELFFIIYSSCGEHTPLVFKHYASFYSKRWFKITLIHLRTLWFCISFDPRVC